MKGYMYILECADESLYAGSTYDLIMRFEEHQNGEGSNYTKDRLPVKLIYYEEFDTVAEAFQREKQIQGWSRAKKLALINRNIKKLELLAQCQNMTHHKNYKPNSNDTDKNDSSK